MGDQDNTDCTCNCTETGPVQITQKTRFEWIIRAFVASLFIIAGLGSIYLTHIYGTSGGIFIPGISFLFAIMTMNSR